MKKILILFLVFLTSCSVYKQLYNYSPENCVIISKNEFALLPSASNLSSYYIQYQNTNGLTTAHYNLWGNLEANQIIKITKEPANNVIENLQDSEMYVCSDNKEINIGKRVYVIKGLESRSGSLSNQDLV